VLLALDGEAHSLLPELAYGERVATLAATEPTPGAPSWIPSHPRVTLDHRGRLHGEKVAVLNGADADLLLVQAHHRDEVVICLVEPGAAGLLRTPSHSIDPTLAVAHLRLDGVAAKRLPGNAAAALTRARDTANLVLSALHSGALAACITMTSEYARLRVAFGQPIGAFQAVKHPLANLHTAWELGNAALQEALHRADHDPEQLSIAAAIARYHLSPAYLRAAADTIQLHGGIGYTWEHDAHLYYKNAAAGRLLYGTPTEQLDIIAGRLHLRDLTPSSSPSTS
jgi:alkylation response protein AidB-like acyl-CoA dehydrogenase